MADIKVKATKRASSAKKTIRVKKIKEGEKSSSNTVQFIDEEPDETNLDDAKCLLHTEFNIKQTRYTQEDEDHEDHEDKEYFQPIDQLISSNIHNKISGYKQPVTLIDEDNQDYVVIGCRFPNGMVICLGKNKILLRGINDMPDYEALHHYKNVGFTKISRSIWKEFLKTHQNWSPLSSGSVFEINNKEI